MFSFLRPENYNTKEGKEAYEKYMVIVNFRLCKTFTPSENFYFPSSQ